MKHLYVFSHTSSRTVKKFILTFAFLLPLPMMAQTLYLYPTTVTAPRGSYQTVTAIVTGVNNKTVTWASDGGTIIGTNPCVVNEPCTAALYSTNTGTYHLTATSNVNGSVLATSTITFTASPTPTTGHPRLLVTAAMLPGLQAKATANNTVYQALRNQAIASYTSDNAVWSWSCNGGSGLPSQDRSNSWEQQNAYLYSFMSMIDPADPTYKWGCYGRDVWTYVMNEIMNGTTSLAANEWSDSSPHFALTTDFLMAGGYLSSSDQMLARSFLAYMVKLVLSNAVGDFWTVSSSAYNSSAEFSTGSVWDMTAMRAMGNNYTESKLLYLVAAGLTFDDNATDDPALPNTCGASRYQVCPDFSAGSLHAYWKYFDGGPLYLQWAHLEDPNVSWQAYQAFYKNLPSQPTCYNTNLQYVPCFGDGRGGEASEGSWYDYSLYRLRYVLNAIHTAGMDDPIVNGPQISMENSSWWDLKYVSDIEFLTGINAYNGPSGTAGGTPAFSYLTTGESNTYERMVGDMWTEAAMLVTDAYTGRTDRTSALLWPILNVAFGGPLGNQLGCNQHCGFTPVLSTAYGASVDEDLFIALPAGDPTASLPADPRPTFPTDLYNGSFNQHIMVRDSWSANNTLFSYYCPNTFIDHEHSFCGRFDIFSNNEYITKGRTEFTDYNNLMSDANQQNVVAIMNPHGTSCTQANGCYFWDAFDNGGQAYHSYQAGLLTLRHDENPAYVAAIVDDTNDYNGSANQFGDYNGVSGASRSLIYFRGTNQVVYYDRAATVSAASKALYQNTTGALSVSGNTAGWHTRLGKQGVYFTSLLPSGAVLSDAGLLSSSFWEQSNDWEPYTTLEVNAGSPLSTQFLSVLQWGSSPSTPLLVQSTGGNNFDGALVGSSLVMFMRSWPAILSTVTYPASGGRTQYVADLTPNATYAITGSGSPSNATADEAGVLVFTSSGSGNITIATGTTTLTSIAVAPAALSLGIGGTRQYTATCNYSDGSSSDCTATVTWSSSTTSVATVNTAGLVIGLAFGTTNIIATSGSFQGQANLTIGLTQAAAPTFSPATGAYSSAQTVAISSATPSATIYYTTDGATPTTSSAVYAGPIRVPSTETVEAIAVAGGFSNSAVATATYTINLNQAATPTFGPAAGVYTSEQSVTISSVTPSATIYYTTNGTTPSTSSAVYSSPIAVSSSETIEAIATAAGLSSSAVGVAAYTINFTTSTIQVATPTFTPAPGTYTSAQTVAIASATPSATIYYTTNGTTPTTSSAVYSGPIRVSSTESLEAIATASGYTNSAVAIAAYTINPVGADFTVSSSTTSLTVTSSQPGTATVSVVPVNGFKSAVSLTCTGLPAGASCIFSQPTVMAANAAASTTLIVSMTGTTTTLVMNRNSSPLFPGSALAVALCCLSWRKRRCLQLLLLLVISVAGLTLLNGCGGATFATSASHATVVSPITVTATSGALQHSTTITVTMK